LEISKKQLCLANCALRDITNEKLVVEKERDSAMKKAAKFEKSNMTAMEDIELLIKELECDSLLELELSTDDSDPFIQHNNQSESRFRIIGFYYHYIREIIFELSLKLYYALLSSGVHVSKFDGLIKQIVLWSYPSVDVSKLELPKRSCASYLRKDELKVISNAHKATTLCNDIATGKALKINTDGTTKNQKKIGGIAINKMTISVNELVDGSSVAVINDVEQELDILRKTTLALGLPNADSISLSMIESSSSDSAATQKHFNHLLLQRREANRENVGNPECDGTNLTFVESFCSIHLGVNLRKAFLSGINHLRVGGLLTATTNHFSVDTFVHQYCKVFGMHGTPEYGCGGQHFPDFLTLMCEG
jgi:hypothetical protein